MSLKDVLAAGLNPAYINLRTLEPTRLWRVYPRVHGPASFNPTASGNARFSPLVQAEGRVVPTMYAATDLDVALMEIVLRDVPMGCAGEQYMLPNRAKEQRDVTQLQVLAPLKLVDLSSTTLRAWNLTRSDAIDCNLSSYSMTRQLGLWIYENAPDAQGIVWTSRQLDRGRAMVFFGDRVPVGALDAVNPGQSLWSAAVQDVLTGLAQELHILLDEEP